MGSFLTSRTGRAEESDLSEIPWFARPTADHRIHPFWFWNGDLRDHELVRQVELMASQGVGGFFICARQGLQVPYLSDEWFHKVRVALEAARKANLNAWLYDEYPYPSGAAGGEVTLLHPEATHRTLEHFRLKAKGGEVCRHELGWDRVLYAKAVPLVTGQDMRLWSKAIDLEGHIGSIQTRKVFQSTGLTAYNTKRFFTANPSKWLHWIAPEGEWELHFFVEREVRDFKYFGDFIDPCNEDAVSTFIRLTHERYRREVGEYFGNTIKGVFTDETGFLGKRPWTPSLPKYFQERNGYDLCEHLHELICSQSETCRKTRYDYFQSLHELLRERYHKPLRSWCDQHGLQYIAEAPSMRATTQIHSHIPAADSGHEKIGLPLTEVLTKSLQNIRYNPKMASSLASQLGRGRALVECFHSVGWSMTLQDAKWMIDRLAAMGVSFFNFHAFFYTTDDLRKHDAPPSLFFQNPYWEDFNLLADYAARISAFMDRTRPNIEIGVVDPTTSLWTRMGNPMESFAYHGDDQTEERELKRLKSDWDSICKTLLLRFRDYEHLDPELLAAAEVRDGVLKVGNSCFRALILPPLTNLERRAWEKIHEFIRAGGIVISYGLLPAESIESQSLPTQEILEAFGVSEKSMTEYWELYSAEPSVPHKGIQRAFFIPPCPFSSSDEVPWLLTLLEECLPPIIRFHTELPTQTFLVHWRQGDEGSHFLFLANQGGSACQGSLIVDRSVKVVGSVEAVCWNLETGSRNRLSVQNESEGSVIVLSFQPYQSWLVEISIKAGSTLEDDPPFKTQVPSPSMVLTLDTQERWELELAEDNVLRLDKFDLVVAGETCGKQLDAKPFINLCQEGRIGLPLDYEQNFGAPVRPSIAYPIDCSFLTRFNIVELPSTCRLVLEEGSICGGGTILINGHPVRNSDFRNESWLGQEKLVCEIGTLLRLGDNHCSVQIMVGDDSHGVVDALYLVGDFGVRLNRDGYATLTAVPRQLSPFGHPYLDLPFYAGTLTFKRSFDLPEIQPNKFIVISEKENFHFSHLVEVFLNGQSLGSRAWSPYRWEVNDSLLRLGENIFEVRIVTGLEGLFEGRYFDTASHRLCDLPKEAETEADLLAISVVA